MRVTTSVNVGTGSGILIPAIYDESFGPNSRKDETSRAHAPWNVDHGLNRIPTLSAPTALTHASATSSTNLARFCIDPPYSSVLALLFVCINWSGRYPFAAWISTPSNPARNTAFSAAVAYHCTYSPISSTVSARGTSGEDAGASSLLVAGVNGIALGATSGYPPSCCRTSGSAVRPCAKSWR